MESLSEYHKYLFLRKVTNTLSADEQKELDNLFLTSNTAENEYRSFVKSLPPADVSNAFGRLDRPEFWKDHLPQPIKKHREEKLILRRTAFAAVTLGVIFCAWLIFSGRILKEDSPALASGLPKTVELKLAGGQIIDLNKQKGTISLNDLSLKNENEHLTYRNNGSVNYGINSIIVPVKMTYKINLPDGSEIWLNADTKMDFPSKFENNRRQIYISGEAYLKIAKDPSKPFTVNLPNASVHVTGTEFNINTYDPANSKVALVAGSVNMSAGETTINLRPGNLATYSSLSHTFQMTPFIGKKLLSWRDGLFYFDEASLDEISEVLWRWFGVKTVIDRSALHSKKFAGILNKNEPIGIFLDNLKDISAIEGYFDKQGVLHFR